ncbi:MAG: LPS export ABC transporter ATP-binding protein, partial [Deltaproteobacteria bacterium]|nr:LPS export ABC transporter ATP-binding protein [Deltaproteobacteria bacterium]
AKSFKKRMVVDDVSLEVRSGRIAGLLGPNGAGKTTIFYMIVGLISPDSGKVNIDNDDITELPMYMRARRGISYLPQEPSVFRKLSVEENIRAVLEFLNLPKDEENLRLKNLMNYFKISHIKTTKAYALSGGERRRVEVARALVNSPAFILLDEPFAGIDPIAVKDIQDMIKNLRDTGIGVLLTDHNVRETLDICDDVYIINEGKILKSGCPSEILKDKEVRKAYLGEGFRV